MEAIKIERNPKERYCRKCGKHTSSDEAAITKKLINRGTTICFCADCLAETFEVSAKDILEKISFYKKMGCTLFQTEV